MEKAMVTINITTVRKNGNRLELSCTPVGEMAGTSLVAVLVQKHATTHIKSGENAGVTVSHTNIVLALDRHPSGEVVNFSLPIPRDLEESNWELIVFCQNDNKGVVSGAIAYDPANL